MTSMSYAINKKQRIIITKQRTVAKRTRVKFGLKPEIRTSRPQIRSGRKRIKPPNAVERRRS